MALNDAAVLTAAKGYIYVATQDTAAPTPTQVDTFNPVTFGCETQTVTITGAPTGGSFTLTFSAQTTAAIAWNATAATVKAAIEALSNVGVGNTVVTGGPLPASAVLVTFVGALAGQAQTLMTATPTLTGGTTPAVGVAKTTLVNGFQTVGHTSRNDLPQFGFDGGDSTAKGTWQNEVLKTVITDAAVDFVTFNLHQFDEAGLALYFGQTNSSATVGEFSVAGSPGAITRKALLIVIVDGLTNVGFHAPRVDVKREDALALAIDEFATLPLRATFVSGGPSLFSWISLDTGVNPT